MSVDRRLTEIIGSVPNWFSDPKSIRIQQLIKEAGGTSRFVGGCVRDAILGIASSDLDICTDLKPEATLRALDVSGVKVIPTGLRHGTITAVIEGQSFEITTLREDIETDGRHAKVRFTDDWEKDAARRDFTFNALSLNSDGRLYDYFGGIADLKAGLVRFIGDPKQRIEEDYLRILRYFRFSARFAKSELHAPSLAACGQLKEGLLQLSKERVTKEILGLLSADQPQIAMQHMNAEGVWSILFGGSANTDRLASLLSHELQTPDPILRLAALTANRDKKVDKMFSGLRLSNAQRKRLKSVWPFETLNTDESRVKEQVYQLGRSCFLDRITLLMAATEAFQNLQKLRGFAQICEIPEFPIRGLDLLEAGMPPGPEIKVTLLELEKFWIDQKFKPTKAELLARLSRA